MTAPAPDPDATAARPPRSLSASAQRVQEALAAGGAVTRVR